MQKIISTIERIRSGLIVPVLTIFVIDTIFLVRRSSSFIADDLTHFGDARTKTLWDMMRTPIDVHFAPLHQLESFIIFKFFSLNFDVVLVFEAAIWIAMLILMRRLLRHLASNNVAGLIIVLFGASPLWLHTLMWWSAAAHRLPYLLLQVSLLLVYLSYRQEEKRSTAFLCAIIQIIALGFFIKAILFPVIIVALELCLAVKERKISLRGIKLCIILGGISVLYVAWYFTMSHVAPPDAALGLGSTVLYAMIYMLRLGALLLFLPLDYAWTVWASGMFWVALACWCIYYRPLSAIPIAALFALLLINFFMSIWGRGWFIIFPLSSLRYYPEVLVIVAVFIALALPVNQSNAAASNDFSENRLLFVLLLVLFVGYPVSSCFSNRYFIKKAYHDHVKAHQYMSNALKGLEQLNNQSNPIVLQKNFPPFIFGYMGMRLPMEDTFGKLYSHIKWLPQDQVKSGAYVVQDNGRVAPLTLLESKLSGANQ